jgi:hypothetical protein
MPVNSTHPDYNKHLNQWTRCRDVMCGQDAVHAAGEKYLPMLKEQSAPDYQAYVLRTPFYNATWRTISGLVGMMLRKPPTVNVPENVKPLLKDVNQSGTPFQLFLQEVCNDALGIGRLGILVDYPVASPTITLADAQAAGLRPTMQIYCTESIINWKCEHINGSYMLTMVVLKEKAAIPKDRYTDDYEDRYRVLVLVEGKYTVELWRMKSKDGKTEEEMLDSYVPLMNNAPLPYIPFVFIGPDGISVAPEDPPLIDLVNVNLSHYRTNADFEHGCHFVGLPTPWIAGYKPANDNEKLYIGSATAWIFPEPDAKAGYLEFTGQGLTALKDNLASKEQQMAILGARMLEPQKKAAEASDSASIRRKGEESLLASMAQAISLGMTTALKWFVEWAGGAVTDDTKAELNRNFFPKPLTAQDLTALVNAWQQAAFSDQTLFENLQQGEIIDSEKTLEAEQAEQNTAPPKLAPGGFDDPNDPNADPKKKPPQGAPK